MLTARTLNAACTDATADEIAWLAAVAKQLPSEARVVILGVGSGVMALALKESRPDIHLLLIDHAGGDYAQAHLAAAGLDHFVTYQTAESAAAGRTWLVGSLPVRLLIIDADHPASAVTADFLAWLPHLVPGAWVFFHDYDARGTAFDGQDYPGVAQAVQTLIPATWGGTRVGTAWVVQVPGGE